MAQGRSRPAWAEIDLAAVAHNARVLARLAAPAVLCAVVKAHGYGHGGPAVARAALAGGAQRLAVALVDEGVELRQHGVTAPVLLLSECGPDAVDTALAYGLTPTLYSSEAIAAFAAARPRGGPRGTGPPEGRHRHASGRCGARGSGRVARRRSSASRPSSSRACGRTCPWPTGSWQRTAPTPRPSSNSSTACVAELAAVGIEAPLVHAANTAGAVAFPRSRHDMVRCGIGLYGYLPGGGVQLAFEEQAAGEKLRPAMALKARVVATRQLEAGERPSYGRRRPLPRSLARGHRAHRLRRRGAPGLVRRGLRGLDRWGPSPARRRR